MLIIRPIHLREAKEYVKQYHRHNIPPVGGKFAVACMDDERLCGVAVCGRPVSRVLDNGQTLEIYRCCTDGTRNACSKLYGACKQIAFRMGYSKVVTYTLISEQGSSLRAAGFDYEGEAGKPFWTGERRRNYKIAPAEKKNRWTSIKQGRQPHDSNTTGNTTGGKPGTRGGGHRAHDAE